MYQSHKDSSLDSFGNNFRQILGATSSKQLLENLAALEVVDKLTDSVMERIDAAMETKPEPDETTAMVTAYRRT